MLTDNQKDLLRLMIHYTQATPAQMKAWGAMDDAAISPIINAWADAKKANPLTQQGVVAEIVALGG